jgi:NitT/TauT family transport system substrate-binding protein
MLFLKARGPATRVAAALALAAGVTAVAGCSGASGAQAGPPPEKPDITVCDFPTIDSAGLFIAQMQGYFKQQGLTVKIEPMFASQQTVTGIENGSCDISSADYVTYVDNELLQHADLKIIAEASFLQPHQLGLLVSPKTQINAITGLAGKTIGVSQSDDIATLLVDSLLAENGVPLDSVHFEPGNPLNGAPKELEEDKFDAALVPDPFLTEGEEAYGLNVVADVDQGGALNFPMQGFAVTAKWAQQNPSTLRDFITALDEGQQKADTDRTLVEQAIVSPQFQYLGVSKGVASVIALPSYPVGVDVARLQRVPDAMVRFGFLPQSDADFNVSSMIYSAPASS